MGVDNKYLNVKCILKCYLLSYPTNESGSYVDDVKHLPIQTHYTHMKSDGSISLSLNEC